MKKLLTISALFCFILINGQKTALIDTTQIDIFSSEYFSQRCIDLINNQNYEKLVNISEKWNKYDKNEASERVQLILDLKNNNFLYSEDLIKNILIYRAIENEYIYNDTVHFLPYYYITDYPKLAQNYTFATKKFAHEINSSDTINKEKKIILEFYSQNSDSVFQNIQSLDHKKSELYNKYREYVTQVITDSFRIHVGLLTGAWIPSGNISVMGNHPGVGFILGFRCFSGWGIDISMMQRINPLKDTVELNFNDTLTRYSDKFLGGFYGINLTRNLYRNVNNEFNAIIGAGFDGFSSVVEYPELGKYFGAKINSFNFNFGISYRRIFKQKYYTELQLIYNIIDYITETNSDLSGNAITVNLAFGILSGSGRRMEILRSLDYKY